MLNDVKKEQFRLAIRMLNEIHETIGMDEVMKCKAPCVSKAIDKVAQKYIKIAYDHGFADAKENRTNGRNDMEWISVDIMPDKTDSYLVYINPKFGKPIITIGAFFYGKLKWDCGPVTHWCRLVPPKEPK